MEKNEIARIINDKHDALFAFLENHPDEKWNYHLEGKWTTGQHIIHLTQSAKALNKGLKIPKLILQYKFGKANRPSRTYDHVVSRYKEKLSKIEGKVISPFSKNMPETPIDTKVQIIKELDLEKEKLLLYLNKLTNKKLDKLLLPHPLMGKMTLREIMMWTAYHTEHHHKILSSKYN